MTHKIVCPVQQSEGFSFDFCRACKSFNLSRGVHLTVRCRKNRSPKHKRNFEGAFLSDYLGIPDKVVVEATEESEKYC